MSRLQGLSISDDRITGLTLSSCAAVMCNCRKPVELDPVVLVILREQGYSD